MRQQGLSSEVVEALHPLQYRRFSNARELIRNVDENVPNDLSKKELKLIMRLSRQSLLRLERIIPHRGIREWSEALIFALVVAAIVRTFLFAPFKIPSGSMLPTIEIGDHIFASMYSFGLPIPFSDRKLFESKITRGEIVIFPYPLDPSVDYIKRVIAVEGDTMEFKGTKMKINGELKDEPYAFYDPVIQNQVEKNGSTQPTFGPITVPKGKLFVMGDNRYNSSDSRVWGFVEASTVRGKGQIIYWSHDPNKGIFGGYRLERIGALLK